MSFTEQKRQEIKKYILRKIAADDEMIIEKTIDSFGISVTSVKRYLKDFLQQSWIRVSEEKKCGYELIEEEHEICVDVSEDSYEDMICFDHVVPRLTRFNQKARDIWKYVCMEMLNNALEHSNGTEIKIWLKINYLYTTVVIADNGLGVFCTLLSALKQKGWSSPKQEDAMVELLKGKITCAPQQHSGEGIFFSSKMIDHFAIWSDNRMISWTASREPRVLQSHLLAYAARIGKVGTCVMMTLENDTGREMKNVFDTYADIDQGFYKTEISVYNACLCDQPISRSQARRICKRLEEFKEVELDFGEIDFMGQGFADEIFRVYALAHPDVLISVKNATTDVIRMVYHVARGKMSENIAFISGNI